jgi:uncharacterized protein YfaS (alpha-2-macroglobulin family)
MKRCPTPEELEEYALGCSEWQLNLSPAQSKHWANVPVSHLPEYFRRGAIAMHLHECADCRQRLEAAEKPLAALREPLEFDPGPDFTDRILAKAQRPLADRMWLPQWPSFSHALSWSTAGLALLITLLVWVWPDGIGDHRVAAMLPPSVSADAPCALPVLVSDREGRPVPNSRVRITAPGMPAYSGRTDRYGVCQAVLTLPEKQDDVLHLNVEVDNRSGKHEIALSANLKDAETLYLSTDKPLYQPGQTVRLRLLCLQRVATTPIASRAITLTVNDPRGNLLLKKELTTSEWGVASLDFPLDTEIEPGDYAIEARAGDNTAGRTIVVSRYTLPKFKATLKTDKSWFLPGETITGTLEARYLFGKPCVGAEARIEGTAESGIGGESFAVVSGTTDAEGKIPFKLRLPAKLTGMPVSGGNAVVTVRATVTDAGGHLQDVSRDYPVSNQAILAAVLPESGAPVVAVENEFYVITSYPDGSPAPAKITLTAPVQATITTDKQGLGSFKFTPVTGALTVRFSARDADGAAGSFSRTLSSVGEKRKYETNPNTGESIYHAPDVLIRTDKPIYKAGEVAEILVLAPGQQGPVYLEITRDKQPVQTQVGVLEDGKARLEMALGQDVGGLLAINAYLPGAKMEASIGEMMYSPQLVARGSRTVLVQPADALEVALDAPKDARPGEEQQATLRVTDKEGNGVSAAVGLAGVDEAVFALENQYPGLARMFFLLQQELDDPSIEVHSDDLPGHFRLEQAIPEAPTPARVALAAYDAQPTLSMGIYNELTAADLRYDAREQRGEIIPLVLLGGIWLLTLITAVSAWRAQIYRTNSLAIPTLIGFALYLGVVAYIASITLVHDNIGAAFFFSLVGWGLLALHRTAPTEGGNWVAVLVSLGVLVIVASIIFPVFAKAREKARQGPVPMRSLGYLDAGSAPSPTTAQPVTPGMPMSKGSVMTVPGEGVYSSVLPEKTTVAADEQSTAPAVAVRVREFFPETLAWLPEIVTDEKGEANITLPAADSITTWRLSLLANAKDGRLGSADIPYQVFQDFFVDADVPVQLTVGDTFSLPVAVHNYAKERQTITLTLDAREGLKLGEKTTATLTLEPDGVGKALFPLHAVEAGRGQITVKAASDRLADAVRRHVDVVPQGRKVEVAANATLRGDTTLTVNVPSGADLDTSDLALRFYPGPVSQALAGLDGMLQKPYGCFEQTTSIAYPNLMILRYLKESGVKDPRTMAKAQTLVMLGYQRLLTFEVKGGGFSLYGDAPAQFALTGLGLAQFQDMAEVQAVDERLLERTSNWLAAHWNDADPVSRSFAALPLARAGKTDLVAAWIGKRGVESDLSSYELALLANAAARTNHALAPALANSLAKQVKTGAQGMSWQASSARRGFESWMGHNSVEITALAVQAFAKSSGHAGLVRKGVDFLIENRSPSGGWSSTQDTVQALRALLEASAAAQQGTISVTVNGQAVPDVKLDGDGAVKSLALGKYLRHGENEVRLRAKGDCTPACQLTARYYTTAPPQTRGPNPVTVTYDKTQLNTGDIAVATVRVAIPRPIDMAMVDLSVPPGFMPLREDLDALKDAGKIARYDITGTQVIFYLKKLDAPATFRYRLRALFPVTATIRASTVYPYYQPELRYISEEGKVKVL